ncbi:hypothetical protein ACHAWF_009872 [Thalassiosira exigua]
MGSPLLPAAHAPGDGLAPDGRNQPHRIHLGRRPRRDDVRPGAAQALGRGELQRLGTRGEGERGVQREHGPGRAGRRSAGSRDALRRGQAPRHPLLARESVGVRQRRLDRERVLRRSRGRPHRAVEEPAPRREQGEGRRVGPAVRGVLPGADFDRGLSLPARGGRQGGGGRGPGSLVLVGHRAPRGPHRLDHLPAQELQRGDGRDHRPGPHDPRRRHRGTSDLLRLGGDQVPISPAPPAGEEVPHELLRLPRGHLARQLLRPAALRAGLLPVVPHVRAERLRRRPRRLRQGRPPRRGPRRARLLRPPREGRARRPRRAPEPRRVLGRRPPGGRLRTPDRLQGLPGGDDRVRPHEGHRAPPGTAVHGPRHRRRRREAPRPLGRQLQGHDPVGGVPERGGDRAAPVGEHAHGRVLQGERAHDGGERRGLRVGQSPHLADGKPGRGRRVHRVLRRGGVLPSLSQREVDREAAGGEGAGDDADRARQPGAAAPRAAVRVEDDGAQLGVREVVTSGGWGEASAVGPGGAMDWKRFGTEQSRDRLV